MFPQEKTRDWGRVAWKAAIIIVALTMLFLARKAIWGIVLIVLPASVLAFLLTPLQKPLEKRFSPTLSALISLFAFILPLGLIVGASIPRLFRQAAQYAQTLPSLTQSAKLTFERFTAQLSMAGVPAEGIQAAGNDLLAKISTGIEDILNGVVSSVAGMGKYLLSPLIAFYLLRDRQRLSNFAKRLLPSKYRNAFSRFSLDITKFLYVYLRRQLIISLITGTLTAIGLALAGVDAFFLLGFIMALFNLIPYFGPFLGAIPILLFALAQGFTTIIWSLVVVVVVQEIEQLFITPRLLSGAVGFHPAVVILLMVFGGSLMGLWGMLLAVPAAAVLKTAFQSFLSSKLYRKRV